MRRPGPALVLEGGVALQEHSLFICKLEIVSHGTLLRKTWVRVREALQSNTVVNVYSSLNYYC